MGMIVPRFLFRPVVGINDSQVFSKNLVTNIKLSFCVLSVTLSLENDWVALTKFGKHV